MSRRFHERRWSHALVPFVSGAELPYRDPDHDIVVTRATARDGWGWAGPMKGSSIHLIDALAVAWTPDKGPILGGRWLCGGVSIGARLINPEAYWETWEKVYRNGGAEEPDDAVCRKCRNARDGVTERPCVYRVWDKSGRRLLYIGSTKDWTKRREQHRSSTWWWQLAKTVDLEHFDTLAAARAAEAQYIRAESPRMNIAHNRGASA